MELYPKGSLEVRTNPDGFGPSVLELAMLDLNWFPAERFSIFGLCSCVKCTGEEISALGSRSVQKVEHWLQLSLLVLLDAEAK